MLKLVKTITLFTSSVLICGSAIAADYDTGATDKEIKFGVTVPLSGPASAYGSVGSCFEGYFNSVNDKGGINGRMIKVLVQDDGYSPAKTLEQTRRLVEREGVLFMAGGLGTPTNSAIHRYMNQRKVPQLFITTGASKWDDPKNYPWTMPYLPSYAVEARIYAKHINNTMPKAKVGILFQNDDFGRDYKDAFVETLKDKSMVVSEVSYDVSGATIDSQMSKLKESGATVFFNISTPKFAAQAIRRAGEIGWKPTQFLVSVASAKSAVLEPAGLEYAKGIISAQYLKAPSDPAFANDPDVKAWHEFKASHFPKGSDANWWDWSCYSAAATLKHVLSKAGDNLTRANIMSIASNLNQHDAPMLLPGIKVNTSSNDFAPIESMSLMRFENGNWKLFGDLISAD
ncbi:MAG: ABC transporter substrate-binding protein [Hyphomicrobiales bacterium]